MKTFKLLQRNLLYIFLCAVFATSCTSTETSTETSVFEQHGKLIDSYFVFNEGRKNYLVYKDSVGVITEIKVSEGVYYHFHKNTHEGHVIK